MLLIAMAHAGADTLEITYTVAFDVNAKGDQICGFTGICDCRSTYEGTGRRVASDAGRLTFEGTWRLAGNSCKDEFTVWVPADGRAFHTVRLDPTGSTLTEWVVHGQATGHGKLPSGQKAGQQFWIDALNTPWQAPGRVEVVQTDGSELAMGVRVDARHTVVMAVGAGPEDSR